MVLAVLVACACGAEVEVEWSSLSAASFPVSVLVQANDTLVFSCRRTPPGQNTRLLQPCFFLEGTCIVFFFFFFFFFFFSFHVLEKKLLDVAFRRW